MPKMRNVHVYVEVDLTLVDHRGTLLPGAVEAMHTLHDGGCHLFLWSTGGADYCRDVATRAGIEQLFEAFLPKPDIFIDDMPGTIFNGPLLDVQRDGPRSELAPRLRREHVHPGERRRNV